MNVISDIVSQHAEEAAFLWLLRDSAVHEPHYSLADLTKLDNRVEAHLDGLRIAGDAGWEMCKEGLEREEPGEIFAAAVVAFESGDPIRIQDVLDVGCGAPELSRGVVSALGWLSAKQAKNPIDTLLAAESPEHRRIGIAAAAVHRLHRGQPLVDSLSDSDNRLVARGLQAVGELGQIQLLPQLRYHFNSEDTLCRFWAAWSATLLGESAAVPVLQAIVDEDIPFNEWTLRILLRSVDITTANGIRNSLTNNDESRRMSLIACGVIGDPDPMPWIIQQMENPEVARVAGEAFTMITGVDIAYDDLDGEWPEGFEAGPTENPEDDDVEMDEDEDLPWPDAKLIGDWWHKNKTKFTNGTRYLVGKPIASPWLKELLCTGMQRQRRAAAYELALEQPDRPLFEFRAPGFRQIKVLV